MNTVPSEEHRLLGPLHGIAHLQETVSRQLAGLASNHAAQSPFIDVLPTDYEAHPEQKVTHVYHDSEPADVDQIEEVASFSNPHFPGMVQALAEQEDSMGELSRMNEDLAGGNNLLVVTNHGDIRDVAEVLAAFNVSLRRNREQTNRGSDFTTEIMLSKMITHLAFFGQPATELLGLLCNRQYFSFPRTRTMAEAGISERAAGLYNKALRGVVHHQLGQGQNLFGIALSGTTDKPIDGEDGTVGMSEVTQGTIKLIKAAPHTKVVPVISWRSEDDSQHVFEVLDIPRVIRTDEEVHALMGAMARRLSTTVPDGTTFRYLGEQQPAQEPASE